MFGTHPTFLFVVEYAVKYHMNTCDYVYVFISGSTHSQVQVEECINNLTNWYIILPNRSPIYEKIKDPVLSNNFFSCYAYDAVLTLSIAINQLLEKGWKASDLSPNEIHQQIVNLNILGASGQITFSPSGERESPIQLITDKNNYENNNFVAEYTSSDNQIVQKKKVKISSCPSNGTMSWIWILILCILLFISFLAIGWSMWKYNKIIEM